MVEADDFGEDGKRRIVHDAAAGRIVEALIVAARPKRAHESRAVELVGLCDVGGDSLVDVFGCVAVVGRELRLELVDEFLVLARRVLIVRVILGGRLGNGAQQLVDGVVAHKRGEVFLRVEGEELFGVPFAGLDVRLYEPRFAGLLAERGEVVEPVGGDIAARGDVPGFAVGGGEPAVGGDLLQGAEALIAGDDDALAAKVGAIERDVIGDIRDLRDGERLWGIAERIDEQREGVVHHGLRVVRVLDEGVEPHGFRFHVCILSSLRRSLPAVTAMEVRLSVWARLRDGRKAEANP